MQRWLFLLTAAALSMTSATILEAVADPAPWPSKDQVRLIAGPIRFDLDFTGADSVQRSALLPSLPAQALEGMPNAIEKLKASPLWTWEASQGGYLDDAWRAMRASVCADFRAWITTQVNMSPNTAYDLQDCVMNPRGYLTAAFETDYTLMGEIKPTPALILNYVAPLNGVTFWVTSPHTCNRHNNCGAQPVDPQFTAVFEADITELCIPQANPSGPGLTLPVKCRNASGITNVYVAGGDVTGKLQAATIQYASQLAGLGASLAASGGADLPAVLPAALADTVNEAYEAVATALADDPHLRDRVSAAIGQGAIMPATSPKFAEVDMQFNALFQNAYFAQLGGLRDFAAGAGANGALEFALTYPSPKKPTLQNATASANGGTLFAPTISLAETQAQPGDIVTVRADYFRGSFVGEIKLAWDKTVLGKTKSTVEGAPAGNITTAATNAAIANLAPNAAYAFTVTECDGLTCAPKSEPLHAATQAAGSNRVVFWLDADKAHPIGEATVGSNGGQFTAEVTIPNAIATGHHTLSAAAPDQPGVATTPIDICRADACGASVALINVSNGSIYPPGAVVMVGESVKLRGARFDSGKDVTIYLDADSGPKAGAVRADAAGLFEAPLSIPAAPRGPHELLAVEAGSQKRATFKVYLQAQPN